MGSIPGSGRFSWRRKWHPTPVFLPGESHGQKSLAGYSPCDLKELDTTEATAGAPCEEGEARGGPASPPALGSSLGVGLWGVGNAWPWQGSCHCSEDSSRARGTPGKVRVGPEGPVTPAAVSGGFCYICCSWLPWDLEKLPF